VCGVKFCVDSHQQHKLYYSNPLWCCGKLFPNDGAMARHEACAHGAQKTVRILFKKRHSYSVGFKAKVCSEVENRLSLRCAQCGEIVQRWHQQEAKGSISDHPDWKMWDDEIKMDEDMSGHEDVASSEVLQHDGSERPTVLSCPGCGCRHLHRKARYQFEVADSFGVHPSLVSKWLKFRSLWFQLCAEKKKFVKMHKLVFYLFPFFVCARFVCGLCAVYVCRSVCGLCAWFVRGLCVVCAWFVCGAT